MDLHRAAAMVQDVLAVAACVLKCVGQYRHRAEVTRLVHPLRQLHGSCRPPLAGERDRPERIADDVAEERPLSNSLFHMRMRCTVHQATRIPRGTDCSTNRHPAKYSSCKPTFRRVPPSVAEYSLPCEPELLPLGIGSSVRERFCGLDRSLHSAVGAMLLNTATTSNREQSESAFAESNEAWASTLIRKR